MVDVNAKTVDGVTPLMVASSAGQREVVRRLLDAKVDVNAKLGDGVTALMVAAAKGDQDVVQALLAATADVNAKMSNGSTALMAASRKGSCGWTAFLAAENRRKAIFCWARHCWFWQVGR